MTHPRTIAKFILLMAACATASACTPKDKPYGRERQLVLAGQQAQVWAIAPVINLSGQPGVDAIIQADLLYQQLQTVQGLTVVPVDRVAQVYIASSIDQIQTPDQAMAVMELLGCQGLIIATVTQYDPYNPPKMGVALQLFRKDSITPQAPLPNPHELVRAGAPPVETPMPQNPDFVQVIGMYDAANGSVRDAVIDYASGRHEPAGPMGEREYFNSMERFAGFAYFTLIEDLLVQLRNGR
ncbi:MAG TPA: hypothetical protein VGB55_02545 [Tepidisphaeraceae bacterium]